MIQIVLPLNVFQISIPKCGTHLVSKLIKMLDNTVKEDVRCHGWTSFDQKQISSLQEHQFLRGHMICNKHNVSIFNENKCKGLLIIRDPRAQVVSMAHWVKKNQTVWKKYKNVNLSAVITNLIFDGSDIYSTQFTAPEMKELKGISDFYSWYLPWVERRDICVVRFEDFVGIQGGGTKEKQIQAIKKIASFLDTPLTDAKIGYISDNLFGGTYTFKEGKIDSWKRYLTQDHRDAFKNVAGQLLIDLGYEDDFEW